jgi:linoleoyl-CoA desaturase
MQEPSTFPELLNEIRARGYFRRPSGRMYAELLLVLTATLACSVAYFAADNWLARICAAFLTGWGTLAIANHVHTSSHYATSKKRLVNEALVSFGMPFCVGLSATYWWHSHMELHHPHPNVIGLDVDQDYGRWFARTREQVEASSGLWRIYYRHLQWLAAIVLTSGNNFKMLWTSWTWLAGRLRDRPVRNTRHWLDLGCLLMHFAAFWILPALWLGWKPVFTFHLLVGVMAGYEMFAVLGPSHLAAGAVCVATLPAPEDNAAWQIMCTVNFRTGWIGRLICAGIGNHIEHHLFPAVSHVYYPEIEKLVRRYCDRQCLPYHCYSWEESVVKCFQTFRNPPTPLPGWSSRDIASPIQPSQTTSQA